MKSTVQYPHIISVPAAFAGQPYIEGTRIRVMDVAVLHEYRGQSAEEIGVAYPHLSPAQVHAALGYYYDHRDEIQADMQAEEVAAEQYLATHPDRVIGPHDHAPVRR